MSFKTQKFSVDKMARHLDYLKLYEQEGEPLDFEILIDGMRAIRRTNNTNRFPLYENFITEDTQKVELIIFQGTSNHNDKYIYFLKEESKELEQSLGDIDSRIEDRVKEAERKWKFDQITLENNNLKAEVAELEKEIEMLEKEKDGILSTQSPLKGLLGEVGASFVESFIKNNPALMKGIPGGQALAGLLEKEIIQSLPQEDAEVTFTSKPPALSKDEQGMLTFAKELKASFTQKEFPLVVEILQSLSENKERLIKTIHYLKTVSDEQV